MKIRWFHTVSMMGILAAMAVSAHAQDGYALKAEGVNPLYPAVSAEVMSVGAEAPAEGDHALNAADVNPFYAGMGRGASAMFVGGEAPAIGDYTLKAADVNPLY